MEHLSTRLERLKQRGELQKILFELPKASWHSYLTEGVWGERLRPGRYRLLNIPFAIYGYSFGDIVRVDRDLGRRVARGVLFRGGHSTFRLFLGKGRHWSLPEVQELWSQLQDLRCRHEHASERLVALDVPPLTEIPPVQAILAHGARSGLWDFEEGHRSPQH